MHATRLARLGVTATAPSIDVVLAPEPPAVTLPAIDTRPALELGQAVLLLMPDAGGSGVGWDHRAEAESIQWIDNPVRTWRDGALGPHMQRRDGAMRVHLMGRHSRVLRQRPEELWWLVQMEAIGDAGTGVQSILLAPGGVGLAPACVGPFAEGCGFDALPSLAASGIAAEALCEAADGEHRIRVYRLTHPQRRPTLLQVSDGLETGVGPTSLTLYVEDPRRAALRTACIPR
jgi:hypothetical protein